MTLYRAFLSSTPPHTRRVLCSAWCPCGSGADWCVEFDVVTNLGLQVKLKAHNTGGMDGAVPVQLYFRKPFASPVRLSSIQLVRFTKVWVPAGGSADVEIELDAADLGYWDDGRNGNPAVGHGGGWVVQPGEYELVLATAGFTSWASPEVRHFPAQFLPF